MEAETKMRLISILGILALSFSICPPALAADKDSARLAIEVRDGGWGTATARDIETVLGSVAGVLLPYFPWHESDRIQVAFSAQGPKVLLDKSSDGSHRVILNVRDTRWDQFAYQFSHELCHIFSNYERRALDGGAVARDHQWFEETLCDTVSLFTLDRLSASWERSPPHPRWKDYAPAFRDYANRLLSQAHRRLPPNGTIAAWYEANRGELETHAYLRDRNELLARALLPLFQNTPGSLASIAFLNRERPASSGSFKAYLEAWYSCCPPEHRNFVGRLISLLEEPSRGGGELIAAAASGERFH
jgi:hypothetical protein